MVAAAGSLITRPWYPTDDWASELAHVGDVGTRHTPLVGVWSRFGWDHPGPLLFWVLAPFEWLFGSRGLLVGAGVLNALALSGIVFIAHRYGDQKVAVLAAAGGALLCRSLAAGVRPGFLLDPWNPYVPLLPFLLFVLLVWLTMGQHVGALPWAVGIGSFLLQAHVGYAILVIGLLAFGGGWLLIERHRRSPSADRLPSLRQPVRHAAAVAAVVWLGPLIQQVTGHPGNLGQIVHYFLHTTERPLGVRGGMGVIGRELTFPGPWVTGHDPGVGGIVPAGSIVSGLLVTLIAGGLGVGAWRNGAREAGRFAALAVFSVGIGTLTASRINGPVFTYLLRWTWMIGAILWVSILWSAVALSPAVGTWMNAIAGVALAALVALTALNTYQITPLEPPNSSYSTAVESLVRQVIPKLEIRRRYAVDAVNGRHTGAGFGLELQRRGYRAGLEKRFGFQYGTWRVARQPVDATLIVVSGDKVAAGWRPPAGSRLLARFDPLTRARQAEATRRPADNSYAVYLNGP